MNATEMKIAAAREALAEVRDGMRLGLGTGSTAAEFVRLLAGRDVRCTCTSDKTEELARSLGIPIFRLAELAPLDLAVDGADAIDERLRLIKGGGGALLREKIVEQAARRFIVIADETKVVTTFAGHQLPVEVTPFAREVLEQRFAHLHPVLRLRDGKPRVTDEGHLILDVRVPSDRDIAEVVAEIRENAGVVETGFFPREATEAIIATSGGIKRMRSAAVPAAG
jgi:ribose 5-phosphate isomerase A